MIPTPGVNGVLGPSAAPWTAWRGPDPGSWCVRTKAGPTLSTAVRTVRMRRWRWLSWRRATAPCATRQAEKVRERKTRIFLLQLSRNLSLSFDPRLDLLGEGHNGRFDESPLSVRLLHLEGGFPLALRAEWPGLECHLQEVPKDNTASE